MVLPCIPGDLRAGLQVGGDGASGSRGRVDSGAGATDAGEMRPVRALQCKHQRLIPLLLAAFVYKREIPWLQHGLTALSHMDGPYASSRLAKSSAADCSCAAGAGAAAVGN